jgi:hypothetical protein
MEHIKWVTGETAKVDRIVCPALYTYCKGKVDIKERRSL